MKQRQVYLIEMGLSIASAAQQIANGLQILLNAKNLQNNEQINFEQIEDIENTSLGYLVDPVKSLNNAIDEAQSLNIKQIQKLVKL